MAVVDEVVQRQDETVAATPAAHGLHRGEDDVRIQPLHLAGHERLADARGRADQVPRQVGQLRELPRVADEHRDGMQLREGADQAHGVAADAVVPVDADVAAVDDDPHVTGKAARKALTAPATAAGAS